MTAGPPTSPPQTPAYLPTPVCRPLSEFAQRRRVTLPQSTHSSGAWQAICAVPAEQERITDWAWLCLLDVAACRHLRHPPAKRPFRATVNAEARLVAQLDALVACGAEAVDAITARTRDGESLEPDVWFAAALLSGWIEGAAGLREAVALLRFAATQEATLLDAVIEAFSLMPHPGVAAALASLANDPLPLVRAAALRIATTRRQIDATQVLGALGDDAAVVVEQAITTIGFLPRTVTPPSLPRLLNHHDQAVAAATLGALTRLAHPNAAHWAEEWLKTPNLAPDVALWSLALLGTRGAVRIFDARLAAAPSVETIEASAWLGHVDLVPRWMALLSAGDEPMAHAAAAALQRLTGASLTETVAVPADPWAEEARQRTGRRFYADEIPPWQIEQLTIDPLRWQAWWAEHQADISARVRMRWGKPLGARELVEALDSGEAHGRERERVALELGLIAGDDAPAFQANDWVRRQQSAVDAWRRWVSSAAPRASGSWRD